MKKLSLITVILLFSYVTAYTQSCLPEGISFSTQAQIDSFQIKYPACTEIEGNVRISGSDITNLNGLNVLTSIGGRLRIYHNYALNSLTGLNNVTSIGGSLLIYYNSELKSLISLNNVTSIGGDLELSGNDALLSLAGLENLTSIGGGISIWRNNALTSLTGIDNISASIINGLQIHDNLSLSGCKVQSVCDYLASSGGNIKIFNNKAGCNSLVEVKQACAILTDDDLEKEIIFYKKKRTKGIVLSTVGLSMATVGILICLNNPPDLNLFGTSDNSNAGATIGGTLLIVGGSLMVGRGIVIWTSGAKNMNKYKNIYNKRKSTLTMGMTSNGIGLKYCFR